MFKCVLSKTSFEVLYLVLFQINLVIAKSYEQSGNRSFNEPKSNWSNASSNIRTTLSTEVWQTTSSKAEILYLNDDSAEFWVIKTTEKAIPKDNEELNQTREHYDNNYRRSPKSDSISKSRRQFSQEDKTETQSQQYTTYSKYRAEGIEKPTTLFENNYQGFNFRAKDIPTEDRPDPIFFRVRTVQKKPFNKQLFVKHISKDKFIEDDEVPSKQLQYTRMQNDGRYSKLMLRKDPEKYQREMGRNQADHRYSKYNENKRKTTRRDKNQHDKSRDKSRTEKDLYEREHYKNKKFSDNHKNELSTEMNRHQNQGQKPKCSEKGEDGYHDEPSQYKEKNKRTRNTVLDEHNHGKEKSSLEQNYKNSTIPGKHNHEKRKSSQEHKSKTNQDEGRKDRDLKTSPKERNRERTKKEKSHRDTLAKENNEDRLKSSRVTSPKEYSQEREKSKWQKRYSVKDNRWRGAEENPVSEKYKHKEDKSSDRDRDRDHNRDRDRDRDHDRDHSRDHDSDRDKDRDHSRDHDRDRDKDRDRDRDRDHDRASDRDRDQDKHRDRDRDRDRDLGHEHFSSSKTTKGYEKNREEKDLRYKDSVKKGKIYADKDDLQSSNQNIEALHYKEKDNYLQNKTKDKYNDKHDRQKDNEPNIEKKRPNKDETYHSNERSKHVIREKENEKGDKKSSARNRDKFYNDELTGRSKKDRDSRERENQSGEKHKQDKFSDGDSKDKDKPRINKKENISGEKSNENKHNTSVRMQPSAGPVQFKLSDLSKKVAKEIKDSKTLNPHSIAKQMQCFLKELESTAEIDQEIIGRTVEYNDIVLWKVKEESSRRTPHNRANNGHAVYADEGLEKKIIFIVHGLTVMGWHQLDCLSNVKRFKTLLSYYFENLNLFDIYLVPMANPDGVSKATFAGWWNKNLSPQKACPGVNVDRNFEVAWNYTLTNNMSSCSQNYPGPVPFSEHESRAIRNIFHRYGQKIVAYLHVHAGTYDPSVFKGDAILYPKGYSDSSGDEDKYIDLKGEIEEAMRNTSFKVISVTVDTLYNWYGYCTGTSVDYASSIYGVPYALELVMQLYDEDKMVADPDQRERNTALTEIWQPLIDIILQKIYNDGVKALERK